jgi:glycosyltransferase involved in cell wall biosynthesis
LLTILHVIDSLTVGGTEWQCLSLLQRLDPARFENILVSLSGDNSLGQVLRPSRSVETIPSARWRRAALAMSVASLVTFMRRHRPDIVQAYGFYSNVPAVLAGRMAGVPILIASRRDMGMFLSRLKSVVERVTFRLADRVVVNAEAIRQELITRGRVPRKKLVLIPTGVDVERFDRLSDSGSFPEWAGTGKVVAMVARFRRQKDQPTFLRAAQTILSVDPTVVFVLAGDGHLKVSIEQLACDLGLSRSVQFVGAVHPDHMPAFLRQIDISVLASRSNEGIPNVVLEAMAAGKPVVATDTGGCSEAVVDGVTGFLVASGSPETLAERVLRLLQDGNEAARMGKAGRERVEAEFTLARMVERFSSLYTDLAHQKLGRPIEH